MGENEPQADTVDAAKAAADHRQKVELMADLLRSAYFRSNATTADGRFLEVAEQVVRFVDAVEERVAARAPAAP